MFRTNSGSFEPYKDTTVLLATHQLTFINQADFIYNLKNGKIIESGTPEEVLVEETEIGQEYQSFVQGTTVTEEKTTVWLIMQFYHFFFNYDVIFYAFSQPVKRNRRSTN